MIVVGFLQQIFFKRKLQSTPLHFTAFYQSSMGDIWLKFYEFHQIMQ